MKEKKFKNRIPLVRKIFIPLIILTVLQALLFFVSVSFSNTENKIKANSESLMVESSARRALFLQAEMTRKQNGLSLLDTAIRSHYKSLSTQENFSVDDFLGSDEYKADFLSGISDDILSSLRINSADGAFLVLANSAVAAPDAESPSSYHGIFFNDTSPDTAPSDYSDIVILRGSSDISDEYNIPLDLNWTDKFIYEPDATDMDYFFTPFLNATTYTGLSSSELGYWSRPFLLSSNNYYSDRYVVSYSEPVRVDGTLIGVFGITLSVDNISSLLPSGEATGNETGCYILFSYNNNSNYITVDAVSETSNGFEQYTRRKLKLLTEEDSRLKKINNVKIDKSQAYCAYTDIEFYPPDSPYASEKWAVGVADNIDNIYADFSSFKLKLIITLILAITLAALTVYFTTRYTTKPINALMQKVRNSNQNNVIGIVDTDISEIHDLSVALNTLSSKRSEYQNELITERKRYLLALRNASESILEYDCINDIFYVYYFHEDNESDEIAAREYPNFRSLVESGRVTHKDYISSMLDFIIGSASEKGVYFKIKTPDENGYIWSYVKSRNVYDNDGNLIRIIASAKNVTEEKEREIKRLEQERRDPVTKFYTAEYGSILVSRFVMEYTGDTAISSILRIVGIDDMLKRYGRTFCSAVLEEVAAVLRRHIPENYVVYRGGMDEFVIITTLTEKSEARAFFRKIIDEIASIYNNKNIRIESVVGAYLRNHSEPSSASKLKTRFASEAAFRFRDEFNGIVFADEVSDKTDFITDFNASGPHNFMPFGNVRLEEVTDIIAFAFNIFEKANNIPVALEVLLSKAGRMLGMDRIILFSLNKDYYTITLETQWNAYGMAPIEMTNHVLGKTDYTSIENSFASVDYKITDTATFECNANLDLGKPNSEGTPYSVPINDKGNVTGIIVYELHEKNEDEGMISCLCELTKIISAYISKSRTSRESRAKSEFLSKMSHEIRTPMNAIIGMTAIAMSSDDIPDYTMECLKKIDSASHYLLSLINDILDMSRIESGKMTTEETYLNLEELIGQIDTMIRVQTENKGIWLKIESSVEHHHLLGDPIKLDQILVNIMGNAVKFTDKGGVHLTVTEAPCETEDSVNITFSVKDTGIGISEENLDKIFNNFEQADTDTIRKYGGTGLGLAISSNLVRLLGGKLEVCSESGKGSEFYFTIPMKLSSPPEKDNNSYNNAILSSKRVLIVEDDELNMEIAKTLIEAEGILTEIAENGQVALDMFCASEENYYDAILMDIRMPVMDGIEATKRIRNTDRADSFTVPIIAMTANAFDNDMKKSVDCGMNGHLTKPIDMNKVLKTFHKIWSAK